MKILFVHDKNVRLSVSGDPETNGGTGGGVQQYLIDLIMRLQSRGHRVSMIGFRSSPAPAIGAGPYYELKSASIRPSPRTLAAFRDIVGTENPDIVHLHSVFYAMHPSAINWLRNNRPTAYTLHEVAPICFWSTKVRVSGELCDFPIGLRCLTRRCYRLGAKTGVVRDVARIVHEPRQLAAHRGLPAIVVPSGYLARQLVVNGFHSHRIHVVANPSRYRAVQTPNVDDSGRRILFVGRLTAEKGVPQLFEALRRLQSSMWEAVIVGDGPLATFARERANEGAWRGRVRVLAGLDAAGLGEEYRAATVVVVPSMAPESFGLAGVEAMAFGKPVVGFDAGGITEWLEHDGTGLLTQRGDVPALAANIDRVLADPELRHRLGRNGLERARTRFDADRHTDQILAIYQTQVAATGGRS